MAFFPRYHGYEEEEDVPDCYLRSEVSFQDREEQYWSRLGPVWVGLSSFCLLHHFHLQLLCCLSRVHVVGRMIIVAAEEEEEDWVHFAMSPPPLHLMVRVSERQGAQRPVVYLLRLPS